MDQMTEAEHAVHEAAANMPAEMTARFASGATMNDDERDTIIQLVRRALLHFQREPDAGATGDGSKRATQPAIAPEQRP